MFGLLMALACLAGIVVLVVKAYKAGAWHQQGVGERSARAEYARILQQGRDVAELHPRCRPVGHGADMAAEIVPDVVLGRGHGESFRKIWMFCPTV